MRHERRAFGFARADLAAVLVTVVLVTVISVPVIAWGGGASGVTQSMSNLTTLGIAHLVYAADWNGRQITWTRDDLGFYADMFDYNAAYQCTSWPYDTECHPPAIAGWGETDFGTWSIWGYWPHLGGPRRGRSIPSTFPVGLSQG